MLVLEEYEHARARGARIYAEVVGFATNSDGTHVTRPEEETMRVVMELALQCAGVEPAAIGYVSGHGTATEQGDIAETRATSALFGPRMPLSSQKSYLGHTLGACGALESIFSIEMMRNGWFAPTVNLENVDPRCGELDYIVGDGRRLEVEIRHEQQLRVRRREHVARVPPLALSDARRIRSRAGHFSDLGGRRRAPAQFLALAGSLAARLPDRPAALNLCERRDNFLVAFTAMLIRGQVCLLPPSRVPCGGQ